MEILDPTTVEEDMNKQTTRREFHSITSTAKSQ